MTKRIQILSRKILRSILLIGLVSLSSISVHILAAEVSEKLIVQTENGPIRGFVSEEKIQIFLGIPYAKPPVHGLRWMPPQKPKPWKAVKDTTHYSSACPQITTLGPFAGPTSSNEDCLYLNVFTKGNTSSKKPVIVWIHGGGNFAGSAADYNPVDLVAGGSNGSETVVVTLNYRLGLFGTFSTPATNNEGHLWGNYGILDQIAALQWVQKNIARFGGDPQRITLGGQSAGAYDTVANMLSPLSQHLFNRAIVMSSPGFAAEFPSAADALKHGVAFSHAAHCSEYNSTCLRNLSAARILQLQGAPNMNSSFITGTPFVDGKIVPLQPSQAWKSGQFNKMPVIGGSTEDEATFFTGVTEYYSAPLFYGPAWKPMSKKSFTETVKPKAFCLWCQGSVMPEDISAHYKLNDDQDDPMETYQRLGSDIAKCHEQSVFKAWAGQIPVYAYDFTYNNAPFYFPRMPGYKPGASHTIDIQFIFRDFHGGTLGVNIDQTTGQPRSLNAREQILADQMIGMWTQFAATGNPNGTGDTPWPQMHDTVQGKYLVQDLNISTINATTYRKKYQCNFWDSLKTRKQD